MKPATEFWEKSSPWTDVKHRFNLGEFITGIVLLLIGLTVSITAPGCAGTVKNASTVNGAVVASVDQAMQAWADYANSKVTGNNPPTPALNSEILAVSNAYVAYYNSELVLSNLSMAYIAAPTNTTLATAISTAGNGLSASRTNLLALIQQFTQ